MTNVATTYRKQFLKVLLLVILTISSLCGNGQTRKFLERFDDNIAVNSYTLSANPDISQEIDPENIDEDLLSMAVMIVINEKRKKKNRDPLEYNVSLDRISRNYTRTYSTSKFKPINGVGSFRRPLKKAAERVNYRVSLIEPIIGRPSLVRYKGSNFWHNRKDTEPGFQLYKGAKPSPKDSAYVPEPVEPHTYRSFAENVVAREIGSRGRADVLDKYYDHMACHVDVVESSIYKSRLPYAKVLIMVSGRRLRLVKY